MQNLKSPPSTSALRDSLSTFAQAMPSSRPTPGRVHHNRNRAMQVRFFRVVGFSAWLFARVVFWQVLVNKWRPRYVERTNLKRWVGYAREFHNFAAEMGGVMIKLGQFFSTRADVLPDEVIAELAGLRDEVPSVPLAKIQETLLRELGPIETRYSWFDEKPIAAASLGQVHRARLHNGDRVVVKVQRPGIDDICYTDLDALRVVARYAMKFRFISRRADTTALAEEFGRVLLEELSYEQEALNAMRFALMFKDDPGVYIPQVYPEHSTDRVITLEDVTTIKLDDTAALEAAGISRKIVAKRLMDTYLKQIFEERFFHADPHPGNLFIYPLPLAEGQTYEPGERPFYLIFIDFGMTGELTEQLSRGLINTLAAVIQRDVHKLIQSYAELGFLLPGVDLKRLEEASAAVFDQVWGMSMSEISNVGYGEMANLGREFSDLLFDMPFQMPQDFVYLGRTVSILSGMCTSLDPTFNPWHEFQPYTQKMIAQSLNATGDPTAQLAGTVLGIPVLQGLFNGNGAQTLVNLGQSLLGGGRSSTNDTVLRRLESGSLTFDLPQATRDQLQRIESQGARTTRAVAGGSTLIASTMLYTNGDIAPAVIGGLIALALLVNALFGE